MDYVKIYNDLIERSYIRKNKEDEYYETHHIIPKCIGGSNDKHNLCRLTPEEHFLAHQLLIKIYPDNYKLVLAVSLMCMHNTKRRINNKRYGWVKRKLSKIASQHFKDMWANYSDEEYMKHKHSMKWTEDRKDLHQKQLKNRYANTEFRKYFSEKMNIVNNDPAKIEKASKKIKENWTINEQFIDKMKKRKPRGSDGSKLKERWADPEFKKMMLDSRKKRKSIQHETN